jgi:hypothetical protein
MKFAAVLALAGSAAAFAPATVSKVRFLMHACASVKGAEVVNFASNDNGSPQYHAVLSPQIRRLKNDLTG